MMFSDTLKLGKEVSEVSIVLKIESVVLKFTSVALVVKPWSYFSL